MRNIETLISGILQNVNENIHSGIEYLSHRTLGGGCINDCYEVKTPQKSYFLKINNAEKYPGMFEAEAKGLQTLYSTGCIRIPEFITSGVFQDTTFLLLEFIQQGRETDNFWDIFAERLALLHRNTQSNFGFAHNNYIGSLPQRNTETQNWTDFFVLYRLSPLIEKAYNMRFIEKGHLRQFELLYSKIEKIIPEEQPALLHGDLWSGNFITDNKGEPCLIDPAVYYGHREAELAFTKLFGGFSHRFYEAYNEFFPLERQWEERIDIFNLYPLLVHLILFGESYLNQITRILRRLV